MPKRTIDGVLDVMHSLRAHGFKDECPRHEIEKAISLYIGDTSEARIRNFAFMLKHGFITEKDYDPRGARICILHHDKAAEFSL